MITSEAYLLCNHTPVHEPLYETCLQTHCRHVSARLMKVINSRFLGFFLIDVIIVQGRPVRDIITLFC